MFIYLLLYWFLAVVCFSGGICMMVSCLKDHNLTVTRAPLIRGDPEAMRQCTSRRNTSQIGWYFKQLLPLEYDHLCWEGNDRYIEKWKMWFGRCYGITRMNINRVKMKGE